MYDEMIHGNVVQFGGLVWNSQLSTAVLFTEYCSKGSLSVGNIIIKLRIGNNLSNL